MALLNKSTIKDIEQHVFFKEDTSIQIEDVIPLDNNKTKIVFYVLFEQQPEPLRLIVHNTNENEIPVETIKSGIIQLLRL